MKERRQIIPKYPKGNGAKPIIPSRIPEKAKKHIRRSGKKRRTGRQEIAPRS